MNYIRDDEGYLWRYHPKRGRIICEDDRSVGSTARAQDGYVCESFEDGVRLLNQYGYITRRKRRKLLSLTNIKCAAGFDVIIAPNGDLDVSRDGQPIGDSYTDDIGS